MHIFKQSCMCTFASLLTFPCAFSVNLQIKSRTAVTSPFYYLILTPVYTVHLISPSYTHFKYLLCTRCFTIVSRFVTGELRSVINSWHLDFLKQFLKFFCDMAALCFKNQQSLEIH